MAVWALYGSESLGRPEFVFWRHIRVSRGLQGVVGLLRSGGLAGQVEIWRHLSKFGGSGRDMASFVEIWRVRSRFGVICRNLAGQVEIWRHLAGI